MNKPIKNGQKTQKFFQRRRTNGQQVHEKMFNITTHHQGNANQNWMRYHFIPIRMLSTKN